MRLRRRVAELEAMVRCCEEWIEFWEKRALALERGCETYEIPRPPSHV